MSGGHDDHSREHEDTHDEHSDSHESHSDSHGEHNDSHGSFDSHGSSHSESHDSAQHPAQKQNSSAPRSDCPYCEWIATKKNLIFEDKDLAVALHPQPASNGHMIVIPKKHFTILEQMPDSLVNHVTVLSNRMSMIQFETLGAQGTNMILPNGIAAGQEIAHVGFHLIPRFENDGLNLAWKSRPLNEEEMATVEIGLRQQLQTDSHAEPKVSHKPAPSKPVKVTDFMLRQLDRVP